MIRKALIPCMALALVACQEDPTESVQYKQLLQDKELLEQKSIEKDDSMNELFDSFNRINDNIAQIRSKQAGLEVAPSGLESGKTMEETIMEDLNTIDQLLTENKALVAKLKKSARKDDVQMKALARTIESLESMVLEKDGEIGRLKEELTSANSSMATLMGMYKEQTQLAESQEEELNKAFYVIGTAKELKEQGIITKTGGFAGVGGVKSINTAGLNKSYFTQVDIRSETNIPLMAKKAKLITSHPDGSFELAADFSSITIKDPQAFWSMSKYLVVQVN